MNYVGQWWRQPDRYKWLSEYLATRRLLVAARTVMTVVSLILAVAVVLISFSPAGQPGPAQAVVWVIGAGFAGMALLYARRWPTARQSTALSIAGSLGIAVTALTPVDPHTGLLTCWAFVGLAAYVASFHTPRLLTFTVGVSLGTVAACAVRTGLAGDAPLAVAVFLLSTGGLLTVPFGGQILVRLVWNDAVSTDPLTGLSNRRGFRRSARTMIAEAARRGSGSFSVVMVDLDGFKSLNDTLGHAVGDEVLVTVAATLREVCGPGVITARVGGEEFVVAQASPPGDMELLARRLCVAIAANRWGVTGSLGVAGITVRDLEADPGTVIERVVASADMAMYEAKRAGGNQIRQATAA